jgi:hypothetical protein
MSADASIAHRSQGRLRLRYSGSKGDRRFFDDVKNELVRHPAVREVDVNPATGSVLIFHDGEADAVLDYARAHELLPSGHAGRTGGAQTVPSRAAWTMFARADHGLKQQTAGMWDIRELAFLTLSIGGLIQMARQQFWPAGFTLFWYAATLLKEKERDSSPSKPSGVRAPDM